MAKYTVCGSEYRSKAAVQREWRARMKALLKQHKQGVRGRHTGGRVLVPVSEGEWFVEAAFLFGKQRARLYPSSAPSLHCCKLSTRVFIDRAGLAFGKYAGKRVSKYMANASCVFFCCATDPSTYRSVSSDLGEPPKPGSDGKCAKSAIVAWLRREIQHQIDRFRNEQKKGILLGTYKCKLCNTALGKIESHVDHGTGTKSFKSIAARFQTDKLFRPLTPEDITSTNIAKRWKTFHLNEATLTMTCRDCNLRNK